MSVAECSLEEEIVHGLATLHFQINRQFTPHYCYENIYRDILTSITFRGA